MLKRTYIRNKKLTLSHAVITAWTRNVPGKSRTRLTYWILDLLQAQLKRVCFSYIASCGLYSTA